MEGRRRDKPPPPPAFSDVTTTVAAASFAARRLPEMQALLEQAHGRTMKNDGNRNDNDMDKTPQTPCVFLDTRGFASGGGKASSRHLRRRVTSWQGRQRYRRPTTTKTSTSRRAQRRDKIALIQKHSTWSTTMTTSSDSADTIPVHWIPTHLWHAKRFVVQNLWHWQVPLRHTNRGTRAALRLATTAPALVQDVTWRTQPVWFQTQNDGHDRVVQALTRILQDDSLASWSNTEILLGEKKDRARYGQAMLHKVDQQPLGAIGPVTFLVLANQPLVSLGKTPYATKEANSGGIYIYLWCHPSIREDLWNQVRQVVTPQICTQGPYNGLDGGLACLQLRGKDPVLCIQQSLAIEPAVHQVVFQAMRQSLETPTAQTNNTSVVWQLEEGEGDVCCLITRPRSGTLPCNWGVCGLDIFGSCTRIRRLFLSCILKGGACPIGVVEESALRLEAQPPLAVFPRDFVDTTVGEAYWGLETQTTTEATTPTTTCRDWAILREHDYGSAGRVRNSPLSRTTIDWTHVVDSDTVILVRGSFLQPFFEAWHGLQCSLPEASQKTNKCTKKRRNVVDPTRVRRLPIPSPEQRSEHESFCERLAASLTLPAALLCHITTEGSGKVEVGTPLYRYSGSDDANDLMGYATAGYFSPWRGSFHGTAIVSARVLLAAIGKAHLEKAVVTRPRSTRESSRSLLLVRLGENQNSCATISLLV